MDCLTPHIPVTVSIIHLGDSTTCGCHEHKHFQPSMDISDGLCISFSYISSPSSVQISGRICLRLIKISDSCYTMLDGNSLASHGSSHVGRYFWLVTHCEDLIRDVMVVGLSMVCHHGISDFVSSQTCILKTRGQSFRQWHVWFKHLQWRFTRNGYNGQLGVFEKVYQTMQFLPLN